MTRENAADILCIGAQRSMTSWLHHVLAAHPGAWAFPAFDPLTSTAKEAHYWDWNHRRGPDWYRVLMRPLDDRLKSLDFTPGYAFLSAAQIAECKALNPTAKVVYILRDPLARAISSIRMRTVWATDHAAADAHRLQFDKTFLDRCANARLWDHGDYARNVAHWRAQYPDLIVVSFEDLRDDPVGGALRLMDQCGLPVADLSPEQRAGIEQRALRRIWETPPYPLAPDCIHFLHGATLLAREACAEHLGLTFSEGAAILEAAR